MKHKIFSCLLVILIVVSMIFAVYYGKAFAVYHEYGYSNNTAETVYFCFTVIFGMASAMTIAALVLHIKAKKGALVDAVYIFAAILCIPVILCTMVWLLHWVGFDFLPPPQN